ncbi:MAG TPA: hypothetical protein VGB46_10810 [Flavisolibacter sp.]|jgi:hypothetical protein
MTQDFKESTTKVDIRKPVSYGEIYGYAKSYITGRREHETLALIMDRDFIHAVTKLGKRVAAVLSEHDGTTTVSLLAMKDDKDQVTDGHINGSDPGQQVWPAITIKDFDSLMPEPGSVI